MKEEGYIKLHRSIMESQVFTHPTALKIWIWCLLKASHRERYIPLKVGKGTITIKVDAGQFIFGRFKAEEALDIEGTTIYRWINKFASESFENMLSLDVHSQYTIVTISNWDKYQGLVAAECTTNAQPMHNQCTSDAQAMHNQCTSDAQAMHTDNNYNNYNNYNNEEGDFSSHHDKNINSIELLKKRESDFRNECERHSKDYNIEVINDFIRYWTEPNKSKTKMRFEIEKTWDLERRLATWHSNDLKFNNSSRSGNSKAHQYASVSNGTRRTTI